MLRGIVRASELEEEYLRRMAEEDEYLDCFEEVTVE